MVCYSVILGFITRFLGGAFANASVTNVLVRMVRGVVVSGGAALAKAARGNRDTERPRSEIKAFHRLCKNASLSVDTLQAALLHLLQSNASKRVIVAVDWTDMGDFKQLVFAVVIGRRAIPVFWWTIRWFESWTAAERAAFEGFQKMLQPIVEAIVIADRGFGTVRFLSYLRDELHMRFVIRTKHGVLIQRGGGKFINLETIQFVRGRVQDLGKVTFTRSSKLPGLRLVRLHDHLQQEPWVLATNLDAPACTVVRIYAQRFLIEETFRDLKSTFKLGHWGMKSPDRLSRQFGIWAIAYVFLTVVGFLGLKRGWQATYQSNSRPRELAIFRLGLCVSTDPHRAPSLKISTLARFVPQLALKTGHWDWAPRPEEVLTEWPIVPPKDGEEVEKKKTPKTLRTERPCDARLRVRIADLLKERGLTQADAARVMDKKAANISAALSGRISLPTCWMADLMKLFGFTAIEELLGDTGWTRPLRSGPRSHRVPVADTTSCLRASVQAPAADAIPDYVDIHKVHELRVRLKKARVTLVEAARAIGCGQRTLSLALSGGRKFPTWWLAGICPLLGLDATSLLQSSQQLARPPQFAEQIRAALQTERGVTPSQDNDDHSAAGAGAEASLYDEVPGEATETEREETTTSAAASLGASIGEPFVQSGASRQALGDGGQGNLGGTPVSGGWTDGAPSPESSDAESVTETRAPSARGSQWQSDDDLRRSLDQERRALGLTQAQLASQAGLNQQYVSALFAGLISLRSNRVRDLAKILGLDVTQWTPEPARPRGRAPKDKGTQARLGQRIDQARRALGLKQRDLAERANTTQQSVSGYLAGKFDIPRSFLDAVCELLGLEVEGLLSEAFAGPHDGSADLQSIHLNA